jgi:hypothetical protein
MTPSPEDSCFFFIHTNVDQAIHTPTIATTSDGRAIAKLIFPSALSSVTLDKEDWLKIEPLLIVSSGGAGAVVVTAGGGRRVAAIVEKLVIGGGKGVGIAAFVKKVDRVRALYVRVVTVGIFVKAMAS